MAVVYLACNMFTLKGTGFLGGMFAVVVVVVEAFPTCSVVAMLLVVALMGATKPLGPVVTGNTVVVDGGGGAVVVMVPPTTPAATINPSTTLSVVFDRCFSCSSKCFLVASNSNSSLRFFNSSNSRVLCCRISSTSVGIL